MVIRYKQWSRKELQTRVVSLQKQLDGPNKDNYSDKDDDGALPSISQISAIIAATNSIMKNRNDDKDSSKNSSPSDEKDQDVKRKQDNQYKATAAAVQRIMKRHKA